MSARPSVLVVEDHALVRRMLVRFVGDDLGLAVAAECGSIGEAAEALRQALPDLVLADWSLPDGTMDELVRTSPRHNPAPRVVVVTADERGDAVHRAARVGIQGFVLKRSGSDALRDAVREVLAGRTYFCPFATRRLVEEARSRARRVPLSRREEQILGGLAAGLDTHAIARGLGTRPKTVANQLSLLRDKLGLRETAALVRYAIAHGFERIPEHGADG